MRAVDSVFPDSSPFLRWLLPEHMPDRIKLFRSGTYSDLLHSPHVGSNPIQVDHNWIHRKEALKPRSPENQLYISRLRMY